MQNTYVGRAMNTTSQTDHVLRSPFSRVFSTPETDQVINCALGLLHPIDVAALKATLAASPIGHHPRFTSLLVPDPHHPSKKRWRKTAVNMDAHVIVIHDTVHHSADPDAMVNSYLADLAVAPPMSWDKPLWEVHVLKGINCVVLRVHHAVGDGMSVMALLTACFGGQKAAAAAGGERGRRGWMKGGAWRAVKSVWYTAVYEVEFLGRILGVFRDGKTAVSGGRGVEHWPRAVATAKFMVDDMKDVKKAIPTVTMNDVLLGVIASGLSKYLHLHSPKAVVEGIQLTSIVLANLRKSCAYQDRESLTKVGPGSPWGNKIGLFLVPIDCGQAHPLQHVTRMKSLMNRKKQSFEAQRSHSLLSFALSHMGSKMGSWFYNRVLSATTLLISNIVGPQEEISIGANPVTFIRICISSLSQAMTLHLVSYKGRADLQISVVKDIIPDAELLAKCFQDALLEMKNVIAHAKPK